jgi:hypothetical protein
MKRKRRHPPAKRPTELVVEKDLATDVAAGTVRSPEQRYSRLEMPHERDESVDKRGTGKPNPVTEQAARDIEQGRVETDCYGATGGRFDRTQRGR